MDTRASQGIVIFAKAPVLGTVKTRMGSVLSQQQALSLHWQLLRHTVAMAQQAEQGGVELWGSANHPRWAELGEINLQLQQGRDLGERLSHALASALQRYRSVVIIGADCPFVDVGYLRGAFQCLDQDGGAVLGPALDGGYVLIGAKRYASQLFSRIDWGGEQVLEQTRQRLRALACPWQELPVQRDIDRPEDLLLLSELAQFGDWAELCETLGVRR